ncbi:hypothetical protein [Kitasatospora sp. CB01950]|uniref:hypothetical protein n=1 Tax=Kitasatospora sp. CB01950 TaxID=1703930 RepID=UPI00093C72D2|nr:hypothetical protein [Kitasatospora sp. CB01950]OKJ08195.1 hypothetical protein AMK19_19380 [Kitasatospora sp. CB01950]
MDDSSRMWITAVPPFGPDEVGVLLSVDADSADPGERIACRLLDRGHEGEEGVFYLLPFDLAARCTRAGDRLVVELVAPRTGIGEELAEAEEQLADSAGEWVTLLRRELVTDFEPAEQDGEKQAVLLIDHSGPVASLDELFGRFEAGEAGIAVINAQ